MHHQAEFSEKEVRNMSFFRSGFYIPAGMRYNKRDFIFCYGNHFTI